MKLDKDVLRYSMRSIIQYLNGDINMFNFYKDKAMQIYRNEYEFILEDVIPESTKLQLYEMVS